MPDRSFVVAGPQYPPEITWPSNVQRIEHVPPATHCTFYHQQRMTLNITRKDMITWGYSPSVRLFEAAASGTCIMSDEWEGLETFFKPGKEILLVSHTQEMRALLHDCPDEDLATIRANAVTRVLKEHTGRTRAHELLQYANQLRPVFSIPE